MKTKVMYLMLAFFAVLTCVSFTSCGSNDDEDPTKGIGNYYLQLSSVETNGVDTDGNLIDAALIEAWTKENKADVKNRVLIGKVDAETAKTYFNQVIASMTEQGSDVYKGQLPEGVYIIYYFQLTNDGQYGAAHASAKITITNSGATSTMYGY